MKKIKEIPLDTKVFVNAHADGSKWSYVTTLEGAVRRISEETEWTSEMVWDELEHMQEDHTVWTLLSCINGEQWGVEIYEITETIK